MTTNPTAPQPKVENWAYPFKAKGGQDVTDPQLYQQALAHAQGGTYLLGSNGLWHGGIHFDEGTSGFLDQSRIHCIADGEVVAYRIDDRVHRFAPEADSEGKTYSTSFVLIRHRLEAPQLPNGTETPPSLVFFSLYMHLLDWAGYEAKPTLPRPAFWGNDRYRVRTQGGKLNVRQEPRANAPVQAELANGSRIRIAGDGEWCEIIEILDNGLTLRPRRTQTSLGYVARRYLEPEAAPKAQNTVVVLDQPFPIKAGALLGHPGLYEGRQQIHLETFSCDDVPAFIERSRAWAVRLPESDKTLLKIHAGASKLITHRPEIDANHPPRIGDPGVQVGVDLILSQAQLDALPAADKITVATGNEGDVRTPEQRWWHLKGLLADGEGRPIEGWLCEQELITSRHSPWEWVSYLTIEEHISPLSALAYQLDARGLLSPEEQKFYEFNIQQAKDSEIRTALYKILDTDQDQKLTSREIESGLRSPWQATAIRRISACYESEWAQADKKWNSLDALMAHDGEHNTLWEEEKIKINTMAWLTDNLCNTLPFKSSKFWHFETIETISNHQKKANLIEKSLFLELYNDRHASFSSQTSAKLSSKSLENLSELIDSLNSYYKSEQHKANICEVAYMLATARHETYHYLSQEFFSKKPEIGELSYFDKYDPILANTAQLRRRAIENGNSQQGDGYKYRGRGCVHLTWKKNYLKASEKFKVDFVSNPDLAAEFKYSVPIMIWGMTNGIFTGKKLKDHINSEKTDFEGARRIINGFDQKDLIAGYARKFLDILETTSSLLKEF
ncbi:hypothetical protein [Pseudomonas oryzihabitans]|uniref:EF-hand domain-containing protein n=2 Tax=cellular organisms TaxID=131567 RepID=A0A1G5MKS2_9PSED|nr:hypothetical protein [Pseudomonas psychrotolerans]NMY88133.1 hypothetical protein [Pseudomonas psychrotolerans]SCZ25766.1 hypothetical protein SAMN05216279_102241 [Pseudomonas psychrotolerans]